jgi:hypothetical protein
MRKTAGRIRTRKNAKRYNGASEQAAGEVHYF